MEETFVALGVLGALLHGQKRIELLADEDGVFHLALGHAGVDVAALDADGSRGGIEVLELEFADLAAVHRVGVGRVEPGDVELRHAAAYLLVGGEADADGAMLELGMLHDILHCAHDLGHARFVVGAKESSAVGGDDGFAFVGEEFGELGGVEAEAGHTLKGDRRAVVIGNDLRLYVFAGSVGGGVYMGDEADGGDVAVHICGDLAHYVAILVEGGLDAHGEKFVTQQAQQVELLAGAWLGLGFFVGLGVDRDIAQESVLNVFHVLLSPFASCSILCICRVFPDPCGLLPLRP